MFPHTYLVSYIPIIHQLLTYGCLKIARHQLRASLTKTRLGQSSEHFADKVSETSSVGTFLQSSTLLSLFSCYPTYSRAVYSIQESALIASLIGIPSR